MYFKFFFLTALTVAPAFALDSKESVAFLTRFYQGYLSAPPQGREAYLARAPFFSKGVQALFEANDAACATKSRGDDICGYGADGDIFLDTQETGPNLNFQSSQFKAQSLTPGTVDVSFNVWPGKPEYQKKIRFFLVSEQGEPRVDDLLPLRGGSPLRQDLLAETQAVLEEAKSLDTAWSWVRIYLRGGFYDRYQRFLAPEVELCTKAKCKPVGREAKAHHQAFERLQRVLETAEKKKKSSAAAKLGAKTESEPKDPKEGQLAQRGGFGFRFADGAWWVVRIDESQAESSF